MWAGCQRAVEARTEHTSWAGHVTLIGMASPAPLRPVCTLVLLAVLFHPTEAHLTSYGYSTSQNERGYSLSASAPADPQAPARERSRLQTERTGALVRVAPLARQAFTHYVQGTHPYVGVRDHVLPQQQAGVGGDFWRTSPIEILDGVEITLFVRSQIPDWVRNQVRRDFLLSQLSPGGILSAQGGLSQFRKPAADDQRRPDAVLEHGLYATSVIVHALHRRDRIRQEMTQSADARVRVLLAAIDATLDGKPIGAPLVDAARALPRNPRAEMFELFLNLSPRTDAAQVTAWLGELEPQRRSQFRE